MQQEDLDGPTWLSPGWRKFLTIVLGAVFFLSFLAFLSGIVVRRHLLDPNLYGQALAETDVYDRVYTEALADPAVQEKIKEVTGINIDIVVGEVYAETVGALRLVLPPTKMQAGTEKVFQNLTAYIAGDTPQLNANLDLGTALTPEVLSERIVTAMTAIATGAVDKTMPIVEKKAGQLVEAELTQYMDQLSAGRLGKIPTKLLSASVAGIGDQQRARLVGLLLGPMLDQASPDIRLQIEAALAADDLPSAISLATRERIRNRVAAAVQSYQPKLAESKALNGVSATAAALGETRDSVVGGLNTVRSLVHTFQIALIPLTILMLVALLSIVWLNSHDFRSALRSIGWTLFGSAGIVMVVWLIAGLMLRSYLGTKLAGQLLFPGLDNIVDDVVASFSRGIWQSVWQTAIFWLVIGLIALAFSYSTQLFSLLRRILAPVWRYKGWVLAGVFGLFVLAPLMWRLATADQRAAKLPCNGHAELCDRPVTDVVFATSHNAMSITEYGWIWPMHDGTITDQLDAGVRGLLIDTHHRDTPGAVAEFLASLSPEEQAITAKAQMEGETNPSETRFLCHKLCQLGATSLVDTLKEINAWLEQNPREVLMITIEDEISPSETESALAEAGLDKFLYTQQADAPWPTLRQMIDSGERLVVMSEKAGPPPDWYLNVWDVTEETPYTFVTKEQFSCKPNRGDTGKPFFLLNHWIQRASPNRVDAAIVNEYDFLLARAQQCAQERGKTPNFVAVNFYSQGDLFDVVNTLNGVKASQ